FMATAMAVMSLAGCGNQPTENSTENSEAAGGAATGEEVDLSEEVELVMYLIGSEQVDHAKVMDKLNEKLKEDLNCTLNLKYIGFGEFDTKYPLILSSGEQIDLIYTSAWLNYPQMVKKGAYMAIDDILEKYAPKTYAESDIETLRALSEDGHIYGLPSNHPQYYSYGIIARGDAMREFGYEKLETIDEFYDFLAEANSSGKYKDALCQSMHNNDEICLIANGYFPLTGGTLSPYWIKVADENHTVLVKSEIPEVQEYMQKSQERLEAGVWSQSVLSNTDSMMLDEGLAAGIIHNVDNWINKATTYPQYELTYQNIANPIYEGSLIQDCMAIPTSAKYPERALMMLELFRQDESYYNLITYGIEGEHYTIDEESGNLQLMNQDKYQYENGTWGFRDDKFFRDLSGAPENAQEVRDAIKNEAQENIYKGFMMDTEPIKNEYAAVQNAITQYYDPLQLGYVDYETGLAELETALEAAGNEACKTELQRQVDEYVAKFR
ncbi:MAG: ABC transporter substrate-binding protein, partial [Lachnospiraceae bacterium]|nr:ABC transporter substrate-binding protein [Lachnospiraceae bacterium]